MFLLQTWVQFPTPIHCLTTICKSSSWHLNPLLNSKGTRHEHSVHSCIQAKHCTHKIIISKLVIACLSSQHWERRGEGWFPWPGLACADRTLSFGCCWEILLQGDHRTLGGDTASPPLASMCTYAYTLVCKHTRTTHNLNESAVRNWESPICSASRLHIVHRGKNNLAQLCISC